MQETESKELVQGDSGEQDGKGKGWSAGTVCVGCCGHSLCAPVRVPVWVWGCLWTGPIATPIPQRHLSLHQTACVPHRFLCVRAYSMHPYQIYATLVCMFVNTPTSGWGIPVYTHPILCVFLSRVPRPTSVYVSLCVHACLSTRVCTHLLT